MKSCKIWIVVLIFAALLLSATACGGLKPPSEQEGASPTQGQQVAGQPTPTAVAAQKATLPPSPTAVPKPSPTPQERPTLTEEETGEIVSPELSDKIKSYRQDTLWQSVEDEKRSEFATKIEWVREGPARRMVMTGIDQNGNPFEWEIIQIADAQYMHMGDEWMSISSGQKPPTGEEMLIWSNPDTWKDEQACEYKGQETFEGQKTKRWSCTKEIFTGADVIPEGTIEEGHIDSWVSVEYDIPIRTIVEWQGKDADGKVYSFHFEAKVYDINEPITIALPEGAKLPGLPEDIPMMEDASEVFAMGQTVSFKVKVLVEDAIAFYKEAMPDNGWKAGEDIGIPGMMTFTKEDRQAQIMITEEDETTTVMILLQGE